MEFKEFLRASKTIIDNGQWVSGKPNKKLINLSKGKFSLGTQWTYRKIVLKAKEITFNIVVAFHERKENYIAHLIRPVENDSFVVAAIEYHSTHPGWHLHVNCEGSMGANIGRLRYRDQRRIPQKYHAHRVRKLPITQAAALEPVMRFFRITMHNDNRSLPLWP